MSDRDVGQSGGLSGARAATVSDIHELMRRKEEIEAQIKANYEVLEGVSRGSERGGGEPGRAGRSGGRSPARGIYHLCFSLKDCHLICLNPGFICSMFWYKFILLGSPGGTRNPGGSQS
uniref:Uncharacterized protein n=1 Tax=Urocitellus parryii TaxID=9999 RepID=A0A8D2GZJ8_UROPR